METQPPAALPDRQRIPDRGRLIINVLLYQAGWLACVLGAAHGLPWLGPLLAVPILAWHLRCAAVPALEARLLGAAALAGLAGESLLLSGGRISPTSGLLVDGLSPPWMVALWPLFATTFNVSLRWLRQRPLLAALLGAIGAPLAYLAGVRLGAATILAPDWLSWTCIALLWAVATPLLLLLARRLDGAWPGTPKPARGDVSN